MVSGVDALLGRSVAVTAMYVYTRINKQTPPINQSMNESHLLVPGVDAPLLVAQVEGWGHEDVRLLLVSFVCMRVRACVLVDLWTHAIQNSMPWIHEFKRKNTWKALYWAMRIRPMSVPCAPMPESYLFLFAYARV